MSNISTLSAEYIGALKIVKVSLSTAQKVTVEPLSIAGYQRATQNMGAAENPCSLTTDTGIDKFPFPSIENCAELLSEYDIPIRFPENPDQWPVSAFKREDAAKTSAPVPRKPRDYFSKDPHVILREITRDEYKTATRDSTTFSGPSQCYHISSALPGTDGRIPDGNREQFVPSWTHAEDYLNDTHVRRRSGKPKSKANSEANSATFYLPLLPAKFSKKRAGGKSAQSRSRRQVSGRSSVAGGDGVGGGQSGGESSRRDALAQDHPAAGQASRPSYD